MRTVKTESFVVKYTEWLLTIIKQIPNWECIWYLCGSVPTNIYAASIPWTQTAAPLGESTYMATNVSAVSEYDVVFMHSLSK